jgi:long-chain acyl-CoA synthetase
MGFVLSLRPALPYFAQVRAVYLTLVPWTIEAGLLTTILKFKRDVLQRLFAREIDTLYAQQPRSRLGPN